MVCISFTSLLLGFLLSLASLGYTIATTHQAIGVLADNRHALGANKELLQGEDEVAAAGRRKGLKGRKMGVQDVVKKEMMEGRVVKTGEAVHSSNSYGSASKNDKETSATKTKPIESSMHKLKLQGDHNAFEPVKFPSTPTEFGSAQAPPAETESLEGATNELYSMLNKDYHSRGQKRPPINNKYIPFEDSDVDDDP